MEVDRTLPETFRGEVAHCEKVVDAFQEQGLLEKIDDHALKVPREIDPESSSSLT